MRCPHLKRIFILFSNHRRPSPLYVLGHPFPHFNRVNSSPSLSVLARLSSALTQHNVAVRSIDFSASTDIQVVKLSLPSAERSLVFFTVVKQQGFLCLPRNFSILRLTQLCCLACFSSSSDHPPGLVYAAISTIVSGALLLFACLLSKTLWTFCSLAAKQKSSGLSFALSDRVPRP